MFFASIDSHWRPLAERGLAPWWTNNPAWFQTTTDAESTISSTGNYAQITIDISHHVGTSCAQPASDSAYSEPTWMASAADYINQGPEESYTPHGPLGGYTSPGMTYHYDTHNTDDSLLPDYLNDYGTLDYARDWIINGHYPVVYGYYIDGTNTIDNAHYGLATGYREKATSWDCEQSNGAWQWVVKASDRTKWQFFINGGAGDSDDWRSPAAYYVGTIKIDVAPCRPTTCTASGVQCGPAPDGCGSALDCGACSAGYECIANQCICQPRTSCSVECGKVSDGCSGTLDCGGCANGDTCSAGHCSNGGCRRQCSEHYQDCLDADGTLKTCRPRYDACLKGC